MLYYAMLFYAMLYYAMLCYTILIVGYPLADYIYHPWDNEIIGSQYLVLTSVSAKISSDEIAYY